MKKFIGILTLFAAILIGASAQAQVTVDYGTTTEPGSPLSFAIENGEALTGSLLAAVQALGVTAGRNDVEMVAPNTTLSAYQSALAAGCPSGSVCDPSTWNWSAENNILTTRANFGKVFAIMHAGNAAMDSCGVRTLCWRLTWWESSRSDTRFQCLWKISSRKSSSTPRWTILR